MNFCPECGTKLAGDEKFCPSCGAKLTQPEATKIPVYQVNIDEPQPQASTESIIAEWSTWLMGLEGKSKQLTKGIDVTIPQFNYKLTSQRLIAEKRGVIGVDRQEIELYNVKDVAAKQSLTEKVLGVGDITVYSADASSPDMIMKRVKDPLDIKEKIRSAARNAKSQMNVHYRQDI